MLAAPREKTPYIVQPRGKPLYDDKSSFGLKMMAKMGWSKEKGLGANEDGQKEFITLRYKNNNSGMGFQEKDDQWTENEGKFDNLLKSLNDTGTAEDRTTESLEEKSKSSRARVHYKKFTRGKDTSRYSAKDLANIFGKKSLEDAPEEKEEEQKVSEEEDTVGGLKHGVETTTSNLSSYDYFKKKLGNFFAKKDGVKDEPQSDDSESKSMKHKKRKTEDVPEEDEGGKAENIVEDPPKKKKKNKSGNVKETTEEITTEEPPKKKKKKRSEQEATEASDPVPDDPTQEEEKPKKKKKKSKSKSVADSESIEIVDNSIESLPVPVEVITVTESPVVEKKKKKKSKKENSAEEDVIDLRETSPSPDQPKEKKSKKKKVEEPLQEIISLMEENLPEEEPPKKKKKKSKNEIQEDEEEANDKINLTEYNFQTNLTQQYDRDGTVHYTISAISAEHLKKLDMDGFKGASFCDLLGYGMTRNIDLKVRETPSDTKAVENLWFQVLEAKEAAQSGPRKKNSKKSVFRPLSDG